MVIPYTVLMFLLGASLTSFFTLLGMRIPKNKKIGGRSVCDHCDETLPWYALLPVLGYFISRGRCRRCEVKISFRYPLYEFLGGVLFAVPFVFMGYTPEYAVYLVFTSMMIIVTVSDIEHMIVPDVILLVFFCAADGLASCLSAVYCRRCRHRFERTCRCVGNGLG